METYLEAIGGFLLIGFFLTGGWFVLRGLAELFVGTFAPDELDD